MPPKSCYATRQTQLLVRLKLYYVPERKSEMMSPEDGQLEDSDLFHPEDQSTGMPDLRPLLPETGLRSEPHVADGQTGLETAASDDFATAGQSAVAPAFNETADSAALPLADPAAKQTAASDSASPSADHAAAAAAAVVFEQQPGANDVGAVVESSTSRGDELSGTVAFLPKR